MYANRFCVRKFSQMKCGLNFVTFTLVSPPDVGSKINLEHILYKVGVGTRCGEGKRQPDDGPDTYCSFPWAEMVVEDL